MAALVVYDYITSWAQHFVFFSGDVQTTTLAIAITGSLCCSIFLLMVSLVTGTSGWHPHGSHLRQSGIRESTPPPGQGLGLLHKAATPSSVVTFRLNRHSMQGSSLSSTFSGRCCSEHFKAGVPKNLPQWNCSKSENSSVVPCIRCGLRAADQLCQLIHCSSCCQVSIADTCDYHGGSPQAAKGLIDGACNHNPTEIDLSYMNLQRCPERVGYIGAQLSSLNLSNNCLVILPDELGCLLGLQELFLQYNCLTTLPASIGNLTQLQELDLKNNSLQTLPQSIGHLSQLRSLKLINNHLRSLPDSIGALSELEELSANANQLTTLPDSICNLTKLMVLHLGDNNLHQLPQRLGHLVRLSELDVAGCELTLLPDSICQCAALVRLWLTNNRLRKLPTQIGRLHQLRELHLKKNELRVLPASLACLHLYTFTASHNPLLEESDEVCASMNRLPAHHVASLWELSACAAISTGIKWEAGDLPQMLQDVLASVQSCSCCGRPMFEHYHSQLVFTAIGMHRVPLYQQVCLAGHGQSKHCRFIAL